jgi:hypothetical protein
MKSYRIVIEYTDASNSLYRNPPEHWDWHDLLAGDADEAVSFVSAEPIPTPEGHKEDLQDGALDELAEIAQKHNMGY